MRIERGAPLLKRAYAPEVAEARGVVGTLGIQWRDGRAAGQMMLTSDLPMTCRDFDMAIEILQHYRNYVPVDNPDDAYRLAPDHPALMAIAYKVAPPAAGEEG